MLLRCKCGGKLTTRAICDACWMMSGGLTVEREAHKPVVAEFRRRFNLPHSPTWPYRTEASAYGESEVYDDD